MLSHDTGIPIYTRTAQMAAFVEHQARTLGVTIPKPICKPQKLLGQRPSQVIVDEVGGVLEDMLGAKVVDASIDGVALNPAIPDLEAMGFRDLFRAWRRARKRKGKQ
jgi:hypothetical protein